MWCINLSNLAIGILWTSVVINLVVSIFHIFAVKDLDYWQGQLRKRVQDNEIDIGNMKIDVEYLRKKEVK